MERGLLIDDEAVEDFDNVDEDDGIDPDAFEDEGESVGSADEAPAPKKRRTTAPAAPRKRAPAKPRAPRGKAASKRGRGKATPAAVRDDPGSTPEASTSGTTSLSAPSVPGPSTATASISTTARSAPPQLIDVDASPTQGSTSSSSTSRPKPRPRYAQAAATPVTRVEQAVDPVEPFASKKLPEEPMDEGPEPASGDEPPSTAERPSAPTSSSPVAQAAVSQGGPMPPMSFDNSALRSPPRASRTPTAAPLVDDVEHSLSTLGMAEPTPADPPMDMEERAFGLGDLSPPTSDVGNPPVEEGQASEPQPRDDDFPAPRRNPPRGAATAAAAAGGSARASSASTDDAGKCSIEHMNCILIVAHA